MSASSVELMSHGIPVVPGSVGGNSKYADSASSSRYQENQCNSRFLKPQPSYYVEEEYDFCQERAYHALLRELPSQHEVEEVTRDLKASYLQGHYSEGCRIPTESRAMVWDTDSVDTTSMEPCYDVQEHTAFGRNWTSSSADPAGGQNFQATRSEHFATARGSVVAQCVDLLERDPAVQAAVVSLARDPAIWDAFVKNDKVQELMRNKQMRLPQLEALASEMPGGAIATRINPVLMALHYAKNSVWDMMENLVDMVNRMFGLVDRKVFGERDSDPVDRPLKACMVLTILVLALVLFKRNAAPSAA